MEDSVDQFRNSSLIPTADEAEFANQPESCSAEFIALGRGGDDVVDQAVWVWV